LGDREREARLSELDAKKEMSAPIKKSMQQPIVNSAEADQETNATASPVDVVPVLNLSAFPLSKPYEIDEEARDKKQKERTERKKNRDDREEDDKIELETLTKKVTEARQKAFTAKKPIIKETETDAKFLENTLKKINKQNEDTKKQIIIINKLLQEQEIILKSTQEEYDKAQTAVENQRKQTPTELLEKLTPKKNKLQINRYKESTPLKDIELLEKLTAEKKKLQINLDKASTEYKKFIKQLEYLNKRVISLDADKKIYMDRKNEIDAKLRELYRLKYLKYKKKYLKLKNMIN
jgi:hypothetical protein